MREHDTPLIDAARHGCAVDVAALFGGGADIEEPKTDGSGTTSLYIACQEGHGEVVTVLLGAGAAVDKVGNAGVTPLHMACHEGHVECTQLLSSHGASRSFSIGGQTISAAPAASVSVGPDHLRRGGGYRLGPG